MIINKPIKVTAVDVFCGVGGLTYGIQMAGIKVAAGIDSDKTCQFAFESNNNCKFLSQDVRHVTKSQLEELYPKGSLKILVGCAPCQPFSNVPGDREDKDEKWKLLFSFADLVEQLNPLIISMENVPQLLTHRKGEVLNRFIDRLHSLKYDVSVYKVNASLYGVPQRRHRLILFGSKLAKVEMIPPHFTPDNVPTVASAIKNLDAIAAGAQCASDSIHRARNLTPTNLERIKATPEGGGWQDWPNELLEGLGCRNSTGGKAFKSAYGRMSWNKPAPTLTTHCLGLSNGRYGHPEQNRAISIREAALLQSFPEDYKFKADNSPGNMADLARHIGNAVPPKLGEAIGKSILVHLNDNGYDVRSS